jgi:conjugal transfer pilus assembly protein TraE
MLEATHKKDLHEFKRANGVQRMTILGLVGVTVMLTFMVLGQKPIVILEPPTRTKAFTITGDRVDAAWLEEMGLWVAHLMLDVTPQAITWQREQILKLTHPDTHGELEQRMNAQAKRLVEANATTSFWPQQIAHDVEGQRVVMQGRLDTYVNGVRTSTNDVAYAATFASKGGRVLLKEWGEVPTDDPWLVKAAEQKLQAEKKGKKS